jgi:polyisoprenoid-binding protein YceI
MVSIDPSSIITGSDIWKDHLTSEDWFDVQNHPQITFQSTSIETADNGGYTVTGDLTIKGESKPVSLDVTINAAMNHPMSGDPIIGLDASGDVLRSDFGMGKFAPNVSDEVALSISVEMLKTKE